MNGKHSTDKKERTPEPEPSEDPSSPQQKSSEDKSEPQQAQDPAIHESDPSIPQSSEELLVTISTSFSEPEQAVPAPATPNESQSQQSQEDLLNVDFTFTNPQSNPLFHQQDLFEDFKLD